MVVVVVFEPPRNGRQDLQFHWAIQNVNIFNVARLDEGFCHSIRLRDRTGVKNGTRPIDRANEIVGGAP